MEKLSDGETAGHPASTEASRAATDQSARTWARRGRSRAKDMWLESGQRVGEAGHGQPSRCAREEGREPDLPMTSADEVRASPCLQRQARARRTMAMSSPRVAEEGPVRINPSSATTAPRWAPTVVVVNNRCLGVGLSLGADGR